MKLKDINISTGEKLFKALGEHKRVEEIQDIIFEKKVSLGAVKELLEDIIEYIPGKIKDEYKIGERIYYPAGVLRVDQQIRFESAAKYKDLAACLLVDEKGELADAEYLNKYMSFRDLLDLCE